MDFMKQSFFSQDSSQIVLYLSAFLFCLAMLIVFLLMQSKIEQKRYFQELSNSFEDSAFICDFNGKILFVNQTFTYLHGPLAIPIQELLDVTDIKKIPLGSDEQFNFKDGKNCDFTIYKLLNKTSFYQKDLFIITIKEKISLKN